MVQLGMPGYVHADLHSYQNGNKKGQDIPYPWTPTQFDKNNHILKEKHPADKLDVSNPKYLKKIVGKFLYYARVIVSTMLMELNSLATYQKTNRRDSKKITHILNYYA